MIIYATPTDHVCDINRQRHRGHALPVQMALISSSCGCSGQRHRAQVQTSQHKSKAGSEGGGLVTPRLATDQTISSTTATVRPLPSPLAHLAAQPHHQQTPNAADAAAAAAADDDNDDGAAADDDDDADGDGDVRSRSRDDSPGTANRKL